MAAKAHRHSGDIMQFESLGLAAARLGGSADPVSAQIKEHVFKVGADLSPTEGTR
jgi:hypothetical protein